ncbi:MAG: hypothetical protein N3D10_00230 [Candidatus Micrarchaeota archaeon]|nr:hypothetical protein [Candidatus Micrarchaeota archaeon]
MAFASEYQENIVKKTFSEEKHILDITEFLNKLISFLSKVNQNSSQNPLQSFTLQLLSGLNPFNISKVIIEEKHGNKKTLCINIFFKNSSEPLTVNINEGGVVIFNNKEFLSCNGKELIFTKS